MSTNFPSSLDDLNAGIGGNTDPLSAPNHVDQHTNESDAIEALEAKVGVDNSAVTTSLDYLVKNTSSSNPGHKHTLANGATDVTATATELNYVDGVTSSIQTQLDGKQLRSVLTTKGDLYVATASNTTTRLPVGTDGYVLTANSAVANGMEWVALATFYAADAGSNDTYVVTLSPALGSYATGQIVRFKANTANTGVCTLNVNSLGAKTIKKNYNVDLADNDIKANQIVEVIYDGTNFQLISPVSNGISLTASGTASRDISTASGTQTIAHGLGTTPRLYRVSAVLNGGTPFAISLSGNSISTSQNTIGSSTTFTISSSNGNYAEGVVTADSTNISIAWTKIGSPTGTANIIWDAIA